MCENEKKKKKSSERYIPANHFVSFLKIYENIGSEFS